MLAENNFFDKYIIRLADHFASYQALMKNLKENSNVQSVESLFQNIETLNILHTCIARDISKIKWSVEIADRHKHLETLLNINQILPLLGCELALSGSFLESLAQEDLDSNLQSKIKDQVKCIKQIEGPQQEAMETVLNKINLALSDEKQIAEQLFFACDHDHINSSQADLLLEKTDNSNHLDLSYVWKKFLCESRKFPCPLALYTLISEQDRELCLLDFISMMKGENVDMTESPLKYVDGTLADQYGEYIKAPGQFAVDITRMEKFSINGIDLLKNQGEKQNANEIVRLLYEKLGKEGAYRIMSFCNQAWTPFFLTSHISGLVLPEGLWGKSLPNKMLVLGQKSGFAFEIFTEGEEVKVIGKILMGLHHSESDFTAHFVMGFSLRIPKDLLISEDLDEAKLLNTMHVTESISHLVIDNPIEAKELFEKF